MAITRKMKLSGGGGSKRKTPHDDFEVSVVVCDHKAAASNCKRRKKISKSPFRPWSELHADLIGELLSRLSSRDQIRFGATCRNLLSNFIITQNDGLGSLQQLPWLVKYDVEHPSPLSSDRDINCHLFDPICMKKEEAVRRMTHTNGGFPKNHTRLLACKGHWMFFSWPDRNDIPKYRYKKRTNQKSSFVLFSPFTKQTVPLPDLDITGIVATFRDYDMYAFHQLGTFSSHPSEEDCVYFIFRYYKICQKVIISTYRQGDITWTTQLIDHDTAGDAEPVYQSAVYHDGCFYCVTNDGNLGCYDILQHEWRNVVSSRPVPRKSSDDDDWLPLLYPRSTHLLVHDGQLHLACVDRPPSLDEGGNDQKKKKDECSVFVFDRSNSSWLKRESLDDCAFFLGRTSFSVLTSPTPSSGSGSGSGSSRRSMREDDADNKIYYVDSEEKLQYYSLKDGESYESVYSCLPGTGIWIEPPRFIHPRGGFREEPHHHP